MESRCVSTDEADVAAVRSSDLRMRDPFVLVLRDEARYYLYGTTDADPWHGDGTGFDAYWSDDLENWHGPHPAFRPPEGFWATRNFWAPEVYAVGSGYVLLASFKSDSGARAVQALGSAQPLGPFLVRGEPLTPPEWECLDGTLYFEEGRPWLVFCREWLQIDDGEICCSRLDDDLTRAVSAPHVLFRASEAPWVKPVQERFHFVTDGPYLHRCEDGTLLMLWSSFARGGYAVGLAQSSSGRLEGPWVHHRRPLYGGRSRERDGGHAMLFRDLEDRLVLTLHRPNRTPDERPVFLPVKERGSKLELERAKRLTSLWRAPR